MNKLTYYTDGACSKNPGAGGYAAIRLSKILSLDKEPLYTISEIYSEYFDNTTNNRMEMMAVLSVLKNIDENDNYKYIIKSDSAYVVNMCNDWIWNWAKNGWQNSKKKEVENKDLVLELYNYLTKNFKKVQIEKVKGHNGVLENELCDALASRNKAKFKKLVKDYQIEVGDYDTYFI